MIKIKVIDNDEQVLKEFWIRDNNFSVISNGDVAPEYTNDFRFLKLDDQHIINQSYQDRASQLINKYSSHLCKANSKTMAFIVDETWEPSDKSSINSKWKIDIQRAPLWFRFGFGFDYIVKMRGHWLEKWSEAQINAAIMSQLLRINPADGSIFKYTEDNNSKMIATFGAGYLEPQTVIEDLLKEDVKIRGFKEASGQITMDELPASSKDDDEADETGDGQEDEE
jgi:hypothetical protein